MESDLDSHQIHVLVTGANGGLGLGICQRLIDDFVRIHESPKTLNIIFTTRSSQKGLATLNNLQAHLRRRHSPTAQSRITFQAENVELTNLLSVRDLARKLLDSDLDHLNGIVCNAGIGGWIGLDWFAAVPLVLADIRNNTVWPTYKLGTMGAVTKSQLGNKSSASVEPPLGEVFCANLFGHYMLVHWLMPLLRACETNDPAKIIWVSSIEPQTHHFDESDLQGLVTDAPYEHSKRVTDLLSLTSNQATAAESIASFTSSSSSPHEKVLRTRKRRNNGPPTMQVYHPGIVVTSVMSLYWIIHQAYMLAIYLARWVGSPWSTVEPYTAAHGATWLVFASQDEIRQSTTSAHAHQTTDGEAVAKDGQVKWGTAINPLGKTTVRSTEVADWGINGSGSAYARDWWGGLYGGGMYGRGRKPDAKEARPEDVKHFIAQGGRVWKEMERLRVDWQTRLE